MNVDKEIENLKQAMAALEAQRSSLGDEVVDSAISPLRAKLDQLRGETSLEQRKLISVLFADLALVSLAQGNLPEALNQVREILPLLERGNLEGADEPAWVYLTCYRALHSSGDPLAEHVLEAGYALLMQAANGLEDHASRQAFLQIIPANRDLLAARGA